MSKHRPALAEVSRNIHALEGERYHCKSELRKGRINAELIELNAEYQRLKKLVYAK